MPAKRHKEVQMNEEFTLKIIQPLRLVVMLSGKNHCIEKYKHNDEPIKCLWLDCFSTGTPHPSIISVTLQKADVRHSNLLTETNFKLHEQLIKTWIMLSNYQHLT
jgi:hypothetical protein